MMWTVVALGFMLALAGVGIRAWLRHGRDPFSPLAIVALSWLVPACLGMVPLTDFHRPYVPETLWLLAGISAIVLVVSALCLVRLESAVRRTTAGQSRLGTPAGRVIVAILFVGSIVALIVAEFLGRGIPLLEYMAGHAPTDLHRYGKDSRLQLFAAGKSVAGLLAVHVAIEGPRLWQRGLFGALAAIVPILGLLKASKIDIALPLLSYAALIWYERRRMTVKAYCVILAVVASVMIALPSVTVLRMYGSGRGVVPRTYGEAIRFRYYEELPSPMNEMVAVIYGYTALPFVNLDSYVRQPESGYRLGTSLLRPIFSLVMHGDLVDEMLLPTELQGSVAPAANVGTFARDLYIEGGAVMVLVGAFVYSLFINWLYWRFRSTGKVDAMLVYVFFVPAWAMLLFQNVFSVLAWYTNAMYILGACAGARVVHEAATRRARHRRWT